MRMSAVVGVRDCVSGSVGRCQRVVAADAVQLVPRCMVSRMRATAMAARESEECHRGHASRTEYQGENVEVHLSNMML
jgi:hypothetical protein